jgi:hypothetical protein
VARRFSRPGISAAKLALEIGERVTIGRHSGIVRSLEPLLGERELRLVVQLLRDDLTAA